MPVAAENEGPDVTLRTVERVESLLREAEEPVSRNQLLHRLAEAEHSTTRQRLNRVLSYLFEHEMIVEGSKGIQWTHATSESLLRARAVGREL